MLVQLVSYPGYYVTDKGEVFSTRRGEFKAKALRSVNGYLKTTFALGREAKSISVHRLVMEAFYGPSPLQVNHRDGNKHNNNVDNLEYVTAAENTRHAINSGLRDGVAASSRERGKLMVGEKNNYAKITDLAALEILKLKGTAPSRKVAPLFGISSSQIRKIWNGRSFKHLREESHTVVATGGAGTSIALPDIYVPKPV